MHKVKETLTIVKKWCTVAAIFTVFMFTGCYSLTTFQSAKALDPGQAAFGGGAAIATGGIFETTAFGRIGLSQNSDVGVKAFGLPGFGFGLFGDMKYQLLKTIPYAAVDFGASFMHGSSDFGSNDWNSVGLYPMVLFGDENTYAGAKAVIFLGDIELQLDPFGLGEKTVEYSGWFPMIFVGTCNGDRIKVMPEVGVSLPPAELNLWAGLAFQLNTK